MIMKDSTIIALLIFTWLLVACVVMGAEAEVGRIERQLEELQLSHNTTSEALEEMRQANDIMNASQDERMDEIEKKLSDQELMLASHMDELKNSADMFTQVLDEMTKLEKKINALPKNNLGLKLSETDIKNIASLVYLEAGSCSYKLQKAIASVIFNRMKKYNMTASQVIYEDGVFSPASRVASTIPSEESMRAVREVMSNGVTLPKNVVAFRNGHYHTFGKPYCKIENVYFTAL